MQQTSPTSNNIPVPDDLPEVEYPGISGYSSSVFAPEADYQPRMPEDVVVILPKEEGSTKKVGSAVNFLLSFSVIAIGLAVIGAIAKFGKTSVLPLLGATLHKA